MGHPTVSLSVDVPALTACGSGAAEAGETLRAAAAAAAFRLAVTEQPGWSSATAIRAAESLWDTHVRALADEVRTFGEGLTASAREFQAADRASADGIRAAGPR